MPVASHSLTVTSLSLPGRVALDAEPEPVMPTLTLNSGEWLVPNADFKLSYACTGTGRAEVHAFCVQNGARVALPGSPYKLSVEPQTDADAAASSVVGDEAIRTKGVAAGWAAKVGLQLRSKSGAGCSAGAGSIVTKLIYPTGEEEPLELIRGTDPTFFRIEKTLLVTGEYQFEVLLRQLGGSDAHFSKSPVQFKVRPAKADGKKATLRPPPHPIVPEVPCTFTVYAHDAHGNRQLEGGAKVYAKLINSEGGETKVEDRGDGT